LSQDPVSIWKIQVQVSSYDVVGALRRGRMFKAKRTMALVRGVLIVATVGSFGLTERGFCQPQTAPSPPQPATASPAPATQTNPTPEDAEKEKKKRDLELQKLDTEIKKMKAETDKATAEINKTAWDRIGPLVSVLTIFILAYTMVSQRKTALDVQKKQGQSELDLQKAEARAALDIKVVDLVMSSRSPALARGRAELLSHLYKEEVRSDFLKAVEAMTANHEFPGDLGHEQRMTVFHELAAKYSKPEDVAVLALGIFGGDKPPKWLENLNRVLPKLAPP
jgi:hypothetical protein